MATVTSDKPASGAGSSSPQPPVTLSPTDASTQSAASTVLNNPRPPAPQPPPTPRWHIKQVSASQRYWEEEAPKGVSPVEEGPPQLASPGPLYNPANSPRPQSAPAVLTQSPPNN